MKYQFFSHYCKTEKPGSSRLFHYSHLIPGRNATTVSTIRQLTLTIGGEDSPLFAANEFDSSRRWTSTELPWGGPQDYDTKRIG